MSPEVSDSSPVTLADDALNPTVPGTLKLGVAVVFLVTSLEVAYRLILDFLRISPCLITSP